MRYTTWFVTLHTKKIKISVYVYGGFLDGSAGKESACNADVGLIPGLGRSPGGENSNPLHYSCLRNPIDKGTWWATVHGVTKSRTQLSIMFVVKWMFNSNDGVESHVREGLQLQRKQQTKGSDP